VKLTDNLSPKELGYLIGLFIGDGYSFYSKNDRHYSVEFYLNSTEDKDIINNVVNLFRKINLNCLVSKDRRYNVIRIRINSKELMKIFNQRVLEFKENKKLNKDYKLGLISGFIDAEGYVKKGEIVLTQKNKKTLEIFKDMIDTSLIRKFWSCKNYKGKGRIWRLRISTKFKYVPHNSYKVRRLYGEATIANI